PTIPRTVAPIHKVGPPPLHGPPPAPRKPPLVPPNLRVCVQDCCNCSAPRPPKRTASSATSTSNPPALPPPCWTWSSAASSPAFPSDESPRRKRGRSRDGLEACDAAQAQGWAGFSHPTPLGRRSATTAALPLPYGDSG